MATLHSHLRRLSKHRIASINDSIHDNTLPRPPIIVIKAFLGFALVLVALYVLSTFVFKLNTAALSKLIWQIYFLLLAAACIAPFLSKLLIPTKANLEQATTYLTERHNILLRFLFFFILLYFIIWISCFVNLILQNNQPFNLRHLFIPTPLEALAWMVTSNSTTSFYQTWIGWTLLLTIGMQMVIWFYRASYRHRYLSSATKAYFPFKLWLGRSTGQLKELAHGASIAPKKQVALGLEDATQNMMVLGGTGSGKTSQIFHPLLLQLFDQDCGGIIFDIKNNFSMAVDRCAQATGKQIIKIGPKYAELNLIQGLTPEVAALFLKSCFTISDQGRADPFWVDTATELCRNTLGILSFFPEQYNLLSLFRYIFQDDFKAGLDQKIEELRDSEALPSDQKRLLDMYHSYRAIFDNFDDRLVSGVTANVMQILSPFNHPELIDAFSSESKVAIEEVLNGTVFLVQVPLSLWGMAGKAAYNLIKLRFFNVMQKREMMEDWNQYRPVFFMCDEYQEIISANKDSLSDLNFWDKSRSSKTIGVISAQAIGSFHAVLGNRDLSNAILQNFRQKLCFKSEDETTLNYFSNLAGEVEIEKVSVTKQSGASTSSGKSSSSGSHRSTSKTISKTQKKIIDTQLFRTMKPNQVLAMLIIDGHSRDDILETEPIYIDSK